MAQPIVLLAGFEPFEGRTVNAGFAAAKTLDGKQIAGHRVVVIELPVVFRTSLPLLLKHLHTLRPTLAIGIGEASTRTSICLERVAVNLDDARIPDNTGFQPIDKPVIGGAPIAYFSALPLKAMLLGIRKANIEADISQSAGTFVCNHVFYGLMHELAARKTLRRTQGGFIHVPMLPQQAPKKRAFTMPLQQTAKALRLAIKAALQTKMAKN